MTNLNSKQIQKSIMEIKVSQALNELDIKIEELDKKKANTTYNQGN